MEKQKNKASGITLVALIITIIILIILATVSISMVLGDGGIIAQAQLAMQIWENASAEEEENLNKLLEEYDKAMEDEEEEEEEEKIIIDTDTSYISYYADVDGDGTVDGIIFADLAIGGSGYGLGLEYEYSYDAVEDISSLKEYYISETTYTDDYFGEGYIITPGSSTTGEDRFYVMALYDSGTDTYWYYNAADEGISDYSTITSTSFGSGKTNTTTMKELWNSSTYGSQNSKDIWGIDNVGATVGESDSIWFIPSRDEWMAFNTVVEDTYSYWYSRACRLLLDIIIKEQNKRVGRTLLWLLREPNEPKRRSRLPNIGTFSDNFLIKK